jgi:hypothetical protein
MRAEPASRYWVIRLPAEIAGHLIVRAHVQNINGLAPKVADDTYSPLHFATWTILGSNQ